MYGTGFVVTYLVLGDEDRARQAPAATYQDYHMCCYPDRVETGPHFLPGLPHHVLS